MKIELQNKLFEKYPKIFRQKDLLPTQTAMCWGIEVGDGWFWLLDKLCSLIQGHIDVDKNREQLEAIQVKEKFGGLRFYCSGSDEMIEGMIRFAEHLSFEICERCGSTQAIRQTEGWIKTLCEGCREEMNYESRNPSL